MSLPTTLTNRQNETLDFAVHPAETGGAGGNRLVILAHGVTGNKDRPILLGVAEALAAAGFGVLRFSFSGNGESEGKFAESTISKEVEDLQAVLDQVGEGRELAYIGHSQGAAVGALVAAAEARIQALVSLAGMVQTAEFCQREFGEVVPGQGVMWEDEDCPLSVAYVDDMAKIGSTEAAAARISVPWLLVHGSEDDVVPPSDSNRALEAARAAGSAELVTIPGANHVFSGREAEVGQLVARWLTENWR